MVNIAGDVQGCECAVGVVVSGESEAPHWIKLGVVEFKSKL